MKASTILGWAVKWSSGPNNVDRKLAEHLISPHVHTDKVWCHHRHPAFFQTRKAAREWRNLHYGYITARRDLREYPHNWRTPRVVRATLTVKEISDDKPRRRSGSD